MEPSETAGASRGMRVGVGAAIVIVLVVAAGVVGVAVWRGATAPVEVVSEHGAGPAQEQSATATDGTGQSGRGPTAATGTAEIFAHVSGAVEEPGLYALADDARVMDAISAAGGLRDDAAADGVNLARPVSDEEQIIVPTQEEWESGDVPAQAGGSTEEKGVTAGAIVDLNAADASQLETLPGIGPALAQRIIAWRDQNGRFSSVDDLLAVSGIGEKVLAGLRDVVRV